MHCPFCDAADTKVIDSRLANDGYEVRRRRECLTCSERFTTFETAELVMPRIVKSDGSRVPFDEGLLTGKFMPGYQFDDKDWRKDWLTEERLIEASSSP